MNFNPPSSSFRSIVLLGQCFFVLAAGVQLTFLWFYDFDFENGLWISCALFTLHIVWALWSWNALNQRLFDSYILFFLSLCSFNGGRLFLETFNLNKEGYLDLSYSIIILNQAAYLVTASIIIFHSAAIYCCLTANRGYKSNHLESKQVNPYYFNTRNLRMLAFLFFVISLPFMIIKYSAFVNLVSQGGYMALYEQESKIGIENWQNVLCDFFLPAVLFFLASAPKDASTVVGSKIMISIYTGICLFLGCRGAATSAALAYLILYHNSVARVKGSFIALLCFGAMSIFPAIQAFRTSERSTVLSTYINYFSDQEKHWYDVISEMGCSFRTIIGTINMVPETMPYDYGYGYQRAALRVLPNIVGVDRDKTYAYRYIEVTDPVQYAAGGSAGFSVIAESYANFSWYGPPIVLGVLGFFLAKFTLWTRRNAHPFAFALEAVLLIYILVLPRAETAVCLRPIVWFCVIPFFLIRCRSCCQTISSKNWAYSRI